MSNLSLSSSLSPTVFDDNLKAIKDFPDDNPNAQIKAYGDKLQRTDTTLMSWAFGRYGGTVLKDTVKVIEATANQGLQNFTQNASTLGNSANLTMLSERIKEMDLQLKKNEELLAGIQRIYSVYRSRYTKEPTHEGLSELEKMTAFLQNEIPRERVFFENLKKFSNELANQEDMLGTSQIQSGMDPTNYLSSIEDDEFIPENPILNIESFRTTYSPKVSATAMNRGLKTNGTKTYAKDFSIFSYN